MSARRCVVCGTPFVGGDAAVICGMIDCRARHDWGSGEWAGRARMAGARVRAGVELNGLDREAIRRAGGAT